MATFNAANTGDWRTAASWAENSGYPVAGDTVNFGAGFTGTITISQANGCAVLDLTGNGGTLAFGAQSLTITANISLGGTITATTGGIIMTGVDTSRIITSNGVTFPGTLTSTNAKTVTLKGNLTLGKGLVVSASSAFVLNKTDVGDGDTLTINDATSSVLTLGSAMSGTTNIVIAGTGCVWSGTSTLSNNLTFNCTSATVSGTVNYKTGILTYTAGTITTTSSILQPTGNFTLDTDRGATKINWNTISLIAFTNPNITLLSNLTVSNIYIAGNQNTTFIGNFDITCGTLGTTGAADTVSLTLVSGTTITITTSLMIMIADKDSIYTVKASTGSSHVHFNYTGLVSECKISRISFTDIDASGSSQSIDNWYGNTLLRCTNIINRTSADLKQTGIINDGASAGTVAQETTLARSGTCVKLTPTSTTDNMYWDYLVPTTALTAFTLKFYHLITATFNGTMTCTIYDTDNTTKLLNAESVSFTADDAYHQYSATQVTPTLTGFCRVRLTILKGAGAGSIYIDDVTKG
jgi:hypothetical protein